MKVGVIALQGAFREHREVLDALGVESFEVRVPEDLGALDAVILPGGESTTMNLLLDTSGLREPLAASLADGLPAFGTCAGLILLATDVLDGRPDQRPLGVLDLSVRRNGYGRQRDSFEAPLDVRDLAGGPFPGVFIRAPVVASCGPTTDVLARHEGVPVLVRTGPVWASAFHPELSGDLRLHQRFLEEVVA
jgi:pyridoxal 5'-phosphate synthase pdxT subunit